MSQILEDIRSAIASLDAKPEKANVGTVVELADGRWAAFEFKVSEDKVADGVASLLRLRRKLCENPRARVREPEFTAVVTGLSRYARRTEEGVYVIPLRCLGA